MPPNQNAQPQNQTPDFNSGINMLPGYSGEIGNENIGNIYDPITPNYQPTPSFIPTARPVPIPRATAVPQYPVPGQDNWRANSTGFNPSYPAPGTPLDQSQQPGFLQRLLQSITGIPGDIGGLFGHLGGQPAPRQTPSQGPGAFGMSIFQSHFPGSLIGPTSGLVTNAYQNSSTPLGGRQPLGGPPSAAAAAFSNTVKARNII